MPCFYRAPTDNDLGGLNTDMKFFNSTLFNNVLKPLMPHLAPGEISYATRWKNVGLDNLQSKLSFLKFDVVGEVVEGYTMHTFFSPVDTTAVLFEVYTTYTIYNNGEMDTAIQIKADASLPPLPRVGMKLQLPPTLSNVTWEGRGPHENYSDRKQSAFFGVHTSSVSDLHTPYIYPTECGGRSDVSWMCVSNNQGDGLLVSSSVVSSSSTPTTPTPTFHMTVSPFSVEELARATHTCDLDSSVLNKVIVHIDHKHMGLGGDASWQPLVHKPYITSATDGPFVFSLRYRPLVNR